MIESAILETPQSVASHYDDLDAFYREIWGLHVHHGLWDTGRETPEQATVALIERVLAGTTLPARPRVCDIGCGYGGTARHLWSTRQADVQAYSVSRAQIQVAESLLTPESRPHLSFLCQDWMTNTVEPGSCELAISIESSEHMPSLPRFFSEAYRVLKPGGELRVCAWLAKPQPASWERRHLLEPICTEGRLHLGTVAEYEGLLAETGFREVAFEDLTDRVKRTWTICLRRIIGKLFTDPRYLIFLMKDPSRNKAFFFSLVRIRVAYELRSMTYGIFSARKGVGV